jgi:hypothetical protein
MKQLTASFTRLCVQVGNGPQDYKAAVDAVKQWVSDVLCCAALCSFKPQAHMQAANRTSTRNWRQVCGSLAARAGASDDCDCYCQLPNNHPQAHLQLPSWNCTTTPAMKVGTTICSATQTVVPWSVLPARVTYMNEGAANFEEGTGVG